jgi:integrase/recombinase XerC
MNNRSIQVAVEAYLQERRRLGFELHIAGAQLIHFARFADAREHRGPLTLDLQLDWARARGNAPLTWARRIEIVRPFAIYYRQFEPETGVPEVTSFGHCRRRLTPHIYTEQEIFKLLEEAGRLSPVRGLRPATYRTLFGLIAVTGLRLSEALMLRDADVDLHFGALTVRMTKFKKSRLLPLHPTTVASLEAYRCIRDQQVSRKSEPPFFVSSSGDSLPPRTVHGVFVGLRTRLGWVARGDHAHPRIHDLRHSFAVRRLQLWHEEGLAIEESTFLLSTYLGHAKISDTYWYLTGVPELLSVVGAKFERFALGAGEVNHA